jgi:hypothetical protein
MINSIIVWKSYYAKCLVEIDGFEQFKKVRSLSGWDKLLRFMNCVIIYAVSFSSSVLGLLDTSTTETINSINTMNCGMK